MDDAGEKIASLERELAELQKRIDDLGAQLEQGETLVRRELNPAIARHLAVAQELRELKLSQGLVRPAPQVLYGPPQMYRRSNRPGGNNDE